MHSNSKRIRRSDYSGVYSYTAEGHTISTAIMKREPSERESPQRETAHSLEVKIRVCLIRTRYIRYNVASIRREKSWS